MNRTSCRSGSGTIAQRKDEKKSNYIQEDTDKSDKDLCMRSVFSPDDLSRTTYKFVYVCGVSSSVHLFRKINIPHNFVNVLILKVFMNQSKPGTIFNRHMRLKEIFCSTSIPI